MPPLDKPRIATTLLKYTPAFLFIALATSTHWLIALPLTGLYWRLWRGWRAPARNRLGSPTSLSLTLSWGLVGAGAAGLAALLFFATGHAARLPIEDLGAYVGGGMLSAGALASLAARARGARLVARWRRAVKGRPVEVARERWGWALRVSIPEGVEIVDRKYGLELGDRGFDARFHVKEYNPQTLAYFTPPRRRALLELRRQVKLSWGPGRLSAPLSALRGAPDEIAQILGLLERVTARAHPDPERALFESLRDAEGCLGVAQLLGRQIEAARRDEAIEGAWARLGWLERLTLCVGIEHPKQLDHLRALLAAEDAPGAARAGALSALLDRGAPHARLVGDLGGPAELQEVALLRLVGRQFCLTPEGLAWFLERAHVTPTLDDALLRMGHLGWHAPLAHYVRGRLKRGRASARAQAADLLGRYDDDLAPLLEALEGAKRADRGPLERAIQRIRARHAQGAGGLALSQTHGEVSLADDAGGLSAPGEGA